FTDMAASIEYIRAGKLRALAVTTGRFPDRHGRTINVGSSRGGNVMKTKARLSRRTLLQGTTATGLAFFGPWKHNHAWAQKTDKPILIGLTFDATGQFGNAGQDEMRGALMALDEANEKGGVLGRKLAYIHADTETTPATGTRVAERMITRNEVALCTSTPTRPRRRRPARTATASSSCGTATGPTSPSPAPRQQSTATASAGYCSPTTMCGDTTRRGPSVRSARNSAPRCSTKSWCQLAPAISRPSC